MAVTRADGIDFDVAEAGVDLSTKLFFLATKNTTGQLILAGADAFVVGSITETAEVGYGATFQKSGHAKVVAGAAITVNARLMSDANGKAIPATAGKISFGYARKAASAADQLVEVEFDRTTVPAA